MTAISPAEADGRLSIGGEETLLAQMTREMEDKWRAKGIVIKHAPPPEGPQPFVVTFPRSKK